MSITSGVLFKKRLNKIGDKLSPCKTPAVVVKLSVKPREVFFVYFVVIVHIP